MNYIAIDLGTTACKTALFDQKKIVEVCSEEYPLYAKGSICEQDANDWFCYAAKGINKLLAKHKDADVKAIAVSGQSISFVPIDKGGNPLYPAINWMDQRAQEEIKEIESSPLAPRIFDITGKPIKASYSLPKLMWLKKNKREIYDKTYKILFPTDYINYRLTGNIITDYTIASGSMMFDINRLEWSDEILSQFKIDKKILPNVQEMGSFYGFLSENAAKLLNLDTSVKVFLGGQDQKLAAIGAGIDGNSVTVSLGTATAVSSLKKTDGAVFALKGGDKIYESSFMSGAVIKWLKNNLGFSSYAEMDGAAIKAGSSGGVKFDNGFNAGGGITGLTLGADRGNIAYALYETIGEKISALTPKEVREIRLFGGGAAGDILVKIIAQKTQKKVLVLDTNETACQGAAMLASQGQIKKAEVLKSYD